MGPYDGARVPGSTLAIVPVLRAGLGMLDAAHELLPHAPVGFVGVTRDEETLRPVPYYLKLPDGLTGRSVLVLDPMLATGGSAVPRDRPLPRGRRARHHAGRADRGARGHRAPARGAARRAHLRGGARRAAERRRLHRPGPRRRGRSDVRHAVSAGAAHRAAAGRRGARAGDGRRAHDARRHRRRADGGARLGAARRHDPARARGLRAGHAHRARRRRVPISRSRATPGRRVAGMTITGSQRIVVSGLGLAPAATARTDPRRVLEHRHVQGPARRRRRGRCRRVDGHRRDGHGRRHHRLDVPALLVALLHPYARRPTS